MNKKQLKATFATVGLWALLSHWLPAELAGSFGVLIGVMLAIFLFENDDRLKVIIKEPRNEEAY